MVMSLLIIGSVLLLQPSTTEAKLKQQLSVSEMTLPGSTVPLEGASRLLRGKKEISMTISTTGLTPGNAHTVWWIIFNNPEKCAAGPNDCGSLDVPSPFGTANASHVKDVGSSGVNATGLIVGSDGVGNFSASLQEGAPPAGVDVLFGKGLKDAQGADVHLIVRDHGAPIAGTVGDQISQLNGGCPPNACGNAQVSIHTAP